MARQFTHAQDSITQARVHNNLFRQLSASFVSKWYKKALKYLNILMVYRCVSGDCPEKWLEGLGLFSYSHCSRTDLTVG